MSTTPESVDALLKSEDYGERLRGINQLRELDAKVSFELIQQVVQDPNARIRYAAVSQISTLGVQNPAKALEILRVGLKDSEADVQAAAADAIAGLKLTEAYEDLQTLYEESSEWLVQFSIVAALGEMGDRRAFDLLAAASESPIDLVQTAAVSALGELGDDRAVPILAEKVNHSDWQLRYRLVQSLGRFDSDAARNALKTLANDTVEQVAQEAKASLG